MYIHHHKQLFSNFRIQQTVKASIVIPVKNEETYIEDLLNSLKGQVDLSGNKIDYTHFEILILANNCTDKTVDLIKEFKKKNDEINLYLEEVTLDAEEANIGYVRKTLMDLAYARLCTNGGGIILTTDGDTIVSKDWICQNMAEIEKGADAVGGRILLKENEWEGLDKGSAFFHKKDEEYQLLIAELEAKILENFDHGKCCHHQHFNGSFAVTTECYKKSGGIPLVKNLEDCAFYERLEKIDARVRHSHDVVVRTSARCIGRTDIGLSQQLNMWKNMNIQKNKFLVESANSLLHRFILKKRLIELWNKRNSITNSIEEELNSVETEMVFDQNIIEAFRTSTYFGEWFQEIKLLNKLRWKEEFQAVEIDEAIVDLRSILSNYSS